MLLFTILPCRRNQLWTPCGFGLVKLFLCSLFFSHCHFRLIFNIKKIIDKLSFLITFSQIHKFHRQIPFCCGVFSPQWNGWPLCYILDLKLKIMERNTDPSLFTHQLHWPNQLYVQQPFTIYHFHYHILCPSEYFLETRFRCPLELSVVTAALLWSADYKLLIMRRLCMHF